MKESIEREQAAVWANVTDKNKEAIKTSGSFGGRNAYGHLLVMLKADKQAVLVSKAWGRVHPECIQQVRSLLAGKEGRRLIDTILCSSDYVHVHHL